MAETKESNGKESGAVPPSRPSVIPLTYPDKTSLYKAYISFTKGGGLFVPTTRGYQMNEEVFLLVTLPDSKKSLPVPGAVIWQTPPSAMDGRKQGVGIEFKGKEGNSLRNRIEGILSTRAGSPEATHTM